MALGYTYVVRTNLPPGAVNKIGTDIFLMWLDFATGGRALNGKKLMYPSGQYAKSIKLEERGPNTVAIIADEGVAPEAAVLESGHRSFDMKTMAGLPRRLPMHRFRGAEPGSPLRRTGTGPASLRPEMWAELRGRSHAGFATLSADSAPGSWIIPAMAAYSPALTLAVMARKMARDMGG